MKNLNPQQPVFISERAGRKVLPKMHRYQQVYIQVKKWFSVLSVTNQVQSDSIRQHSLTCVFLGK